MHTLEEIDGASPTARKELRDHDDLTEEERAESVALEDARQPLVPIAEGR